MNHNRILAAYCGRPWAIHPAHLDTMLNCVQRGIVLEPQVVAQECSARLEAAERDGRPQAMGGIAVLDLMGVLRQRSSGLFDLFFGVSSMERWTRKFNEAVADPAVEAIVLNVDSPGGEAAAVVEPYNAIMAARGKKPIVAIANSFMASAAVWIASAADEIVAMPQAIVGSVGVLIVHDDWSEALDEAGIKVTYFRSVPRKAEANQDEPLTDKAGERLQALVDDSHRRFIDAIARGRGIPKAEVTKRWGKGEVYAASEALERKMVDRVETMPQLLERLASPRRRRQVMALEEELRLA